MQQLTDQVALITGSTSGIGAAGARLFAEAGARVVINGLSEQRGDRLVADIESGGGEAIFIRADVGSLDDLSSLVAQAKEHFGRIDIFWHNAGDAGPGRIDLVTEEAYDRTMNIHLKAGFFGSQFIIPELLRSEKGCILLTGSGAAFKPLPGSPTYSIVKAGLAMLAKCLAVQLGPHNIRVNCLCPGPTRTPLREEVFSRHPELIAPHELDKANVAATPLGRVSEPEEVARVALFLVSEDASYITGETILVDGGLIAGPPSEWLQIEAPTEIAQIDAHQT